MHSNAHVWVVNAMLACAWLSRSGQGQGCARRGGTAVCRLEVAIEWGACTAMCMHAHVS